MDDFPVSRSKALGCIARARRTSKVHLRLHVDTLQARVRELEGDTTTREGYIQKEIAKSLARERDL